MASTRFVAIRADGAISAYEMNLAPVTFFGTGYYRVASGIDVTESMFDFTITEVILLRAIAGSGGQTKVDVKVNGVSIFTPGGEPVVLASAGNDARDAKVPSSPAVVAGNSLAMDITEVEDGFPQDITVILKG